MLWLSLEITVDTWNPLLLHRHIQVATIDYMVKPRPTTIPPPTRTTLRLSPVYSWETWNTSRIDIWVFTRFSISDNFLFQNNQEEVPQRKVNTPQVYRSFFTLRTLVGVSGTKVYRCPTVRRVEQGSVTEGSWDYGRLHRHKDGLGVGGSGPSVDDESMTYRKSLDGRRIRGRVLGVRIDPQDNESKRSRQVPIPSMSLRTPWLREVRTRNTGELNL